MTEISSIQFDELDNLYTWFEHVVSLDPEKIAVIDAEGDTSYRLLRQKAEAVHAALVIRSIRPNQRVAILMERSSDLIATILGILRAGCTYIPLDPRDPQKRIAKMISQSDVAAIFSDLPESILQKTLPDRQNHQVIAPHTLPMRQSGVPVLAIEPGRECLAYMLYTSGTTGEPKAVMISQANLLQTLFTARNLLGVLPTDRYLAVSTVAFDASVTELLLPLVSGASLLLKDSNLLLSPKRLANEIRTNGVTIMQTAPSVWARLLSNFSEFPKVRVAITHGEAITMDLANRLAEQGERVFNLYGPTETTVWATGHLLGGSASEEQPIAIAPIGHPLAHVQSYVVDEKEAVLDGEAEGELWLGGPSVARGYWKDEIRTQDRFRRMGSDWVYRTGDRVRRDSKGTLHFLGRLDDQLQVNGVRVEPQEIEAIVLEYPAVAAAVATWYDHPVRGRHLLLVVQPQPDQSPSSESVRDFLSERLPRRMMPSCILVIAALPLTRNGKIDKSALRELAVGQFGESPDLSKPKAAGDFRSVMEQDIAEIWRVVLGASAISREDNFFVIGGDSLTAVHMILEIETLHKVHLNLNDVYESPTLRSLARRVEEARIEADFSTSRGFVFPIGVSDSNSLPMFFCNVDLSLARRGTWTLAFPIFAVWHWSRGEGLARAKSLEQLATLQLSRIREVQREGPYRLGGYSFGGLLAYEMAQQLQQAGETVECLFLLDPTPPGVAISWANRSRKPASFAERARDRADRILYGPGRIGWAKWFAALFPTAGNLRTRLIHWKTWLQSEAMDWRIRNPKKFRWFEISFNPWVAFAHFAQPLVPKYLAAPYTGKALLVTCEIGHDGKDIYGTLLNRDTEKLEINTSHLELFRPPSLEIWMEWLDTRISDSA